MARKQWWAASVHIYTGDLGAKIRDRFGPVGLCMWVGFLAACKRSVNPGKISYTTDGECLSLMGLEGMEMVDEDGEPFTLDDFWTFLGHHKQTSRTGRRRLTYVTATRFGDWQQDANRQKDAERKRRSRDETERTEPGHEPDEIRTDTTETRQEKDSDPDTSSHLSSRLRAVGSPMAIEVMDIACLGGAGA